MEESSFILCTSNASTDIYPDNSLSNFTNLLPKTLLHIQEWEVALESIIINMHNKGRKSANHFRVQLQEIETRSNTIFNRTLAIISIGMQDENVLYFESTQREYFPFQSGTLSKLKIMIEDMNGEYLMTNVGQPTWVKLSLRKKMFDSHLLRFSPLDSKYLFPKNKNENFWTQLGHTLALTDGNWEMALTSIHYPLSFEKEKLMSDNELILVFEWPLKNIQRKIELDSREFTHSERIINYLNRIFNRAMKKPYFLHFACTETNNLVVTSNQKVTLSFSFSLAHILGGNMNCEVMDTNLRKIILNGQSPIQFQDTIRTDRLVPNSMLLYCNIISPSIVGSTYAKVLKLIPIFNDEKVQNNSIVCYESQNLDFVTLSTNTLSSINFELRTSSGHLVPFKNDSGVIINILLRRK